MTDKPINIDLGISAKAELRAEIPSSSVGRLVDALTDVLRPFTERMGLKGDLIRLQREDVSIEIARRARLKLEIERREIHPVKLKTLVPLLEKASLEDIDDDEMLDRWAALLAAEASGPYSNRRWCIDILSSIDGWQAQLIDKIAAENQKREFFRLENFTREYMIQTFSQTVSQASRENVAAVMKCLSELGGYTLLFEGKNIPKTEMFEFSDLPEIESLLHLDSIGLVWVHATSFLCEGDRHFVLNAHLTPLGFQFASIFQKKSNDGHQEARCIYRGKVSRRFVMAKRDLPLRTVSI